MIFAAYDYWQYARKAGRYGSEQRDVGMAVAFLGTIPAETIDNLWPGDAIFTQRLDSIISWAMMYLTSSPVDHVAIYIGNGRIMHVTLDGTKQHRLGVFGKNTRILPVRFGPLTDVSALDPPASEGLVSRRSRPSHILPPKGQLAWVGLRILLGLHPERYRIKFLADIIVIAACADTAIYLTTGWFIALPIAGIFALSAGLSSAFNALRRKLGYPLELLSHPDIMYRAFFRAGGLMFTTVGDLVVCDFGILPLKLFRALGRKGTEDSTPDELKELRQRVLDLSERWNAASAFSKAEHEQGQKNDDEQV